MFATPLPTGRVPTFPTRRFQGSSVRCFDTEEPAGAELGMDGPWMKLERALQFIRLAGATEDRAVATGPPTS